jgi:hypothetical protein
MLRSEAMRGAVARASYDKVESMVPLAVSLLVDVINDPSASHRDKIRAVEAVLDRSHMAKSGKLEITHVAGRSVGGLIAEVSQRRQAWLAGPVGDGVRVIDAQPDTA